MCIRDRDTLAELRGKWGAQVPALLDERFDAVGVQYMKLPHKKGAAALGQELSAFGWALYNLDDEDEYLFALIPEEERSEWERYCKKQGQYCHLMKQQGRKWGDHAKEQDPGTVSYTHLLFLRRVCKGGDPLPGSAGTFGSEAGHTPL